MRLRLVVVGLSLIVAGAGCSVNILENFADKNTNEALFEDAKVLLNDEDYQGALDKLALLTGAFASTREVIALKASANAGICGINFLNFVRGLKNLGSQRLFQFLFTHFSTGTAARIDACRTAEDLVESIGGVSDRTSDENMLLVLISFAKIGNILNLYADAFDRNNSLDAGFDAVACNDGGTRAPALAAAAAITVADQRELGTGLTLALANISAVSSSVDLGNASLDAINDACDDLQAINASYNFCTITDPAAFTANHLNAIQALVRENTVVGLGSCAGDVSTCMCM